MKLTWHLPPSGWGCGWTHSATQGLAYAPQRFCLNMNNFEDKFSVLTGLFSVNFESILLFPQKVFFPFPKIIMEVNGISVKHFYNVAQRHDSFQTVYWPHGSGALQQVAYFLNCNSTALHWLCNQHHTSDPFSQNWDGY